MAPPLTVLGTVRVRLTGDLPLGVQYEGLTAGLTGVSSHQARTGFLPALVCLYGSPAEDCVGLTIPCGGADWETGGAVTVIGTSAPTFFTL